MLKSVIAHHKGKTWHVPAIFPEEFGSVFTEAGFEREELVAMANEADIIVTVTLLN